MTLRTSDPLASARTASRVLRKELANRSRILAVSVKRSCRHRSGPVLGRLHNAGHAVRYGTSGWRDDLLDQGAAG